MSTRKEKRERDEEEESNDDAPVPKRARSEEKELRDDADAELREMHKRNLRDMAFRKNMMQEARRTGYVLLVGEIVVMPAAIGPGIWNPRFCVDANARKYLEEVVLARPDYSIEHRLARRYLLIGAEIGKKKMKLLPKFITDYTPKQLGMREATFAYSCAGSDDEE